MDPRTPDDSLDSPCDVLKTPGAGDAEEAPAAVVAGGAPGEADCSLCRPLRRRLYAHRAAIGWAREVLDQPDWVVLDTETTGLGPDAEVIELTILDATGQILVDTLLRPQTPIPAAATAIHGLNDADVADAPTFPAQWERIRQALAGRRALIYHADYDARILAQTARRYALPWEELVTTCAMRAYAAFRGEPHADGSLRWHALEAACQHLGIALPGGAQRHRAADDCRLTLALVRAMAAAHEHAEAPRAAVRIGPDEPVVPRQLALMPPHAHPTVTPSGSTARVSPLPPPPRPRPPSVGPRLTAPPPPPPPPLPVAGASYSLDEWRQFVTQHWSRILGLARRLAPDLSGPWLRPQTLVAGEDGAFVLHVEVRRATRGAHLDGDAPRDAIAQAIQDVLGVRVQVEFVPATPR